MAERLEVNAWPGGPQPRSLEPSSSRPASPLRRMSDIAPLRHGSLVLQEAADAFLHERDLAPSTRRVYRLALEGLSRDLGAEVEVATITQRDLAAYLGHHHADAAPKTWNRIVATFSSFFAYCVRQGWVAASPAVALERRRERVGRAQADRTRAIPVGELEDFLAGAEHHLRERLLWRMLYETAARAHEVLLLDVEHLELANRRATVVGKSGNAEWIGWETATARLLARYLRGRTSGPLFLADRRPSPARQPALADVEADSGRSRLSYRRAAHLFTAASDGRWTLHQLRHSRLTHLAEAGVDLPLLMTKSRHSSVKTLTLYARPTFNAVAEATARLDPARRR